MLEIDRKRADRLIRIIWKSTGGKIRIAPAKMIGITPGKLTFKGMCAVPPLILLPTIRFAI
ncbi:MAG: hypothetical protein V8T87_14545 [Victivallales bacterium]